MARVTRNIQDELNGMSPAASHAQLGSVLNDLITNFNAALAKLDADATVTDEDFAATLSVTPLEDRDNGRS